MTADTDQRTKLVEWNDDLHTLVFKGTAVPVATLWVMLRDGETFKDFLHKHAAVPVPLVLRVIRIAGELLCDWPWERPEQEEAYRVACERGDPRFTTGAVRFHPDVRDGRLLCSGDCYKSLPVVWDNIQGGTSTSQIEAWYQMPAGVGAKLVTAAAALFEEGLVPGENLPGRRHPPRRGGTP